jgi:hypothetical protein
MKLQEAGDDGIDLCFTLGIVRIVGKGAQERQDRLVILKLGLNQFEPILLDGLGAFYRLRDARLKAVGNLRQHLGYSF